MLFTTDTASQLRSDLAYGCYKGHSILTRPAHMPQGDWSTEQPRCGVTYSIHRILVILRIFSVSAYIVRGPRTNDSARDLADVHKRDGIGK